MPTYAVTGARSGIRYGYVAHLSSSPSNTVPALVRSLDGPLSDLRTLQASSEARIHIVECDVSSEPSILALPSRLGTLLGDEFKIDVLINNAAVLSHPAETSLTLTESGLVDNMTANVLGPARTLQVLLPHFHSRSKGIDEEIRPRRRTVVANITSGAGSKTWVRNGVVPSALTGYAISKAALNMLTVHQAKHLESRGVVVVAVDPGHVKTPSGGPGATLEVEDCVKGVLGMLDGLRMEDTGKFYLYDGREVPW
ncbi:C-factor [Colletotrichum sidae]|uniref:C-factor n=1 Tax=Colletotrichum sidae TaxID=1347389 RepID=A0A4R8TSI4_9PEZI|nr:C-factor [Colletotrichum sidae]